MNKRLLFLGADSSTKEAVEYAKSQGVYTIVADYNPTEKVIEKQIADAHWEIDVSNIDALERRCREEEITGVYAGNQEFCLDQCKELCGRLGFPFYASNDGWHAARDKAFFKEVCQECGLAVPKRYQLDENLSPEDVKKIHFPVIVKPTDSCGQQGLSIVYKEDELASAFRKALDNSVKKDIIVEDYIVGDEVYLFCFIHDGKVALFALSEVMMTEVNGRMNFGLSIQHGRYNDYVEKRLLPVFEKLVKRLGCENGACVFQGICKEGVYYNLEFGYRLDGIRSWRHTKRRFGFSQLELMVDLALGIKKPDKFWDSVIADESVSAGYMIWIKPGEISRIEGRNALYEREDVIFILDNYKEGDIVQPNDNMRSIAFDIVIYGKTQEELGQKIDEINKILHVYDKQGNDMLIHSGGYYEQWKNRMDRTKSLI